MLTRLREGPSVMLRMLPVLLGVDNETEGARPVTSADVGDLPVELFMVIAKESACTGPLGTSGEAAGLLQNCAR